MERAIHDNLNLRQKNALFLSPSNFNVSLFFSYSSPNFSALYFHFLISLFHTQCFFLIVLSMAASARKLQTNKKNRTEPPNQTKTDPIYVDVVMVFCCLNHFRIFLFINYFIKLFISTFS